MLKHDGAARCRHTCNLLSKYINDTYNILNKNNIEVSHFTHQLFLRYFTFHSPQLYSTINN